MVRAELSAALGAEMDLAQQSQQNVFPQLLPRNQDRQHELFYIEGTDKKDRKENEDHWEKITPENCHYK